jgi:ABC-type lipoprotein export system ATPase subunit
MTLLAEIATDASRGVLVVTHDPRILPFANRVVRIEDGRIVGEEKGGAAAGEADEELIEIEDVGGIQDYAQA